MSGLMSNSAKCPSMCMARCDTRTRAASQGHIVVDLDHHAATTEQEHRAQLRVARHANDNFYTFSYHLLHRHADDPSLWRIGLGTSQDFCVGRSYLCRIAEVQPNDPGLCLVRNIPRIELESHRKPELLCGLDGGLCRICPVL